MYCLHVGMKDVFDAFYYHPVASWIVFFAWIGVSLVMVDPRSDEQTVIAFTITAYYFVLGVMGTRALIWEWGKSIGAINYFLGLTAAAAIAVGVLIGILIGMRHKRPEVRK